MISKATSLTEWRMGKIELQILIVIQYEIRNMSTSVIKFTYAKAQWRVWNATNALPLRAAALPLRCRCAAAALPPRCRRAAAALWPAAAHSAPGTICRVASIFMYSMHSSMTRILSRIIARVCAASWSGGARCPVHASDGNAKCTKARGQSCANDSSDESGGTRRLPGVAAIHNHIIPLV